MGRPDFEELQVYRLSEKLANEIWKIVIQWDSFYKDTVGKQIVRAADSIGSNIAEGRGRYNFQDNKRFIKIDRGSLNETIHWMRLDYVRKLLTIEQVNILKPLIDELSPKLNAYLNSLGNTKDTD
ncbi:four helix bundle protein [Sphaerospermopsis kisseleviana CS-549]|uniref:S23 ribosomal protein n=3 Tax=Sphaerospermopsis TaxID=752201 RepID=A0A480A3Q4_9CYAN|nr:MULTISPECIES: four helix bundle protein [Sphaerospermopsis]BAZ80554.1 S23 ribosomal protein [Sphaerospermopsis kisseleviana NIES-73]MBD2134773.1 four helix bundle protein [Sphaerospermopsis sp. FACHB-1094]MBE9236056.1 four helix bundle protein [Sphaerospermopsis aphanizomenoides LEGE 00250]MDB9442320.1 four helix bundle protein [Sphaerospermopsis kisseleviana CS-549]GCL39605.1 S23 ribosomal protein [Sphaerospermopsis reniformis]